MTWGELFDRVPGDVTEADVRRALGQRRADDADPPSRDREGTEQ